MNRMPRKSTTYADFLYRQVDRWFAQEGRPFTLKEFAEFAHLPITGNMRRRLQHSVAAGTLHCWFSYNAEGGSVLVYDLSSNHERLPEL